MTDLKAHKQDLRQEYKLAKEENNDEAVLFLEDYLTDHGWEELLD